MAYGNCYAYGSKKFGAPGRNRTCTRSFGGSCDIHFTTGASIAPHAALHSACDGLTVFLQVFFYYFNQLSFKRAQIIGRYAAALREVFTAAA